MPSKACKIKETKCVRGFGGQIILTYERVIELENESDYSKEANIESFEIVDSSMKPYDWKEVK